MNFKLSSRFNLFIRRTNFLWLNAKFTANDVKKSFQNHHAIFIFVNWSEKKHAELINSKFFRNSEQ